MRLPQSGSGKTITTSAAETSSPSRRRHLPRTGTAKLRVRLIDSVGETAPGAVGATEDGQPRDGDNPLV